MMTNALKDKLAGDDLITLMSAHNPLSARLAEEAGFDGIWASGFELSAAYGVPDASLLSLTQHLDKLFPKDTSLLAGGRQELVRVEEFQGKIAAAREAGRGTKEQPHDLIVIARTEALIADLGLDEALKRGMAYAEAGADLLLVHSKRKTPDEIVAFTERWNGPIPLVIVPTAYPDLTEAKVRALGKIRIVIYANHAIRAAVGAMRQVFAQIRRDGGIHNVDKQIASVEDIFELQRVPAMKAAEKKYLR